MSVFSHECTQYYKNILSIVWHNYTNVSKQNHKNYKSLIDVWLRVFLKKQDPYGQTG